MGMDHSGQAPVHMPGGMHGHGDGGDDGHGVHGDHEQPPGLHVGDDSLDAALRCLEELLAGPCADDVLEAGPELPRLLIQLLHASEHAQVCQLPPLGQTMGPEQMVSTFLLDVLHVHWWATHAI